MLFPPPQIFYLYLLPKGQHEEYRGGRLVFGNSWAFSWIYCKNPGVTTFSKRLCSCLLNKTKKQETATHTRSYLDIFTWRKGEAGRQAGETWYVSSAMKLLGFTAFGGEADPKALQLVPTHFTPQVSDSFAASAPHHFSRWFPCILLSRDTSLLKNGLEAQGGQPERQGGYEKTTMS